LVKPPVIAQRSVGFVALHSGQSAGIISVTILFIALLPWLVQPLLALVDRIPLEKTNHD